MRNRTVWPVIGMLGAVFIGSGPVPAAERRTPVVEVVERVGPAVVNITARSKKTFIRPLDPFGMFGQLDQRTSESLGSGVLIDPQGYVITNFHVIDEAHEVQVVTQSGQEYGAMIVGTNREYDLAVLKVEAEHEFPAVRIAYEEEPLIGETVIAAGNPYGLNNTVTVGVVSALHRTVEAPWGALLTGLIQTDAAINRGNSGGPLLNLNGDLMGINTSILSESGGSQGIGFAVSARRVQRMYEQHVLHYLSLEARLGMEVIANDARISRRYRTPPDAGCLVWEVEPHGYGERAGIEHGDVITQVNGKRCETPTRYGALLAELGESQRTVRLTVVRRNTGQSEDVKVEVHPEEARLEPAPLQVSWRGMVVEELTEEMARRLKLANNDGVHVRAVVRNGEAYTLGIRPDDVVYEVDGTHVGTMKEFSEIIGRVGKDQKVRIRVKRPQPVYGGARLYHGVL